MRGVSSIPSDTWNFQNETKIFNSISSRTGVGNSFSKAQRQVWDFYATYNKSVGKHIGAVTREDLTRRNMNVPGSMHQSLT